MKSRLEGISSSCLVYRYVSRHLHLTTASGTRYDGNRWHVHQLANAGARLYPSEQDYAGLAALESRDSNTVYVSSPIDPHNEAFLRVLENFSGVTADGGSSWSWSLNTINSRMDNLRTTVPVWDNNHTALIWMRGTNRLMHD